MALRSGSIQLSQSGSPTDRNNWLASMAYAIEEAFLEEWPFAMKDDNGDPLDPPEMNDHARLMFTAIAKGVVKHLTENGSAFEITVNDVPDHRHSTTIATITYNSTNEGGHNHAASINVAGTVDS